MLNFQKDDDTKGTPAGLQSVTSVLVNTEIRFLGSKSCKLFFGGEISQHDFHSEST